MRWRGPKIPPRRPIFLGCEGESEVGYGGLIGRIAKEQPRIHVHVHVQLLQPGAGNPLTLIQRAIAIIADLEQRRSSFAVKAVLLDVGSAQKNREATECARRGGIDHTIWQTPDHEALLLRHLEGCERHRPPAGASLAALQREWADYEKGMSAQSLARRIDIEDIRRACTVEAELCAFLNAVGLV